MALSLSPKLMSAEVVIPSVVITPVTSMPVEVVASFVDPLLMFKKALPLIKC